jgi:hypothetical protein
MAFRTCTWCGRSTSLDLGPARHPLPQRSEAPHQRHQSTLLKLRELLGWLTPAEATRWTGSISTFTRNLRTSSGGQLLQVLTQLENISGGIGGIHEALGRE